MDEVIQPRRGPGRPRKYPPKAEVKQEPKSSPKLTVKPNWESLDPLGDVEDTPDKLRIDKSLIPEGFDLLWVTSEVFGQPEPGHRADFERKGWTPVHQADFQGQFNGMFMKKDSPGEINVHGLVLMCRPLEYSIRAKQKDRRAALEQVMIKEAELRGGNIPVSLDAQHPSAVNTNRINKSYERIEIPDK